MGQGGASGYLAARLEELGRGLGGLFIRLYGLNSTQASKVSPSASVHALDLV